jgi:hypothetical protein
MILYRPFLFITMSRTKQRGKRFSEWWGKRLLSGHTVSNKSKTDKFSKRLLHKMGRVQGKKWIQDELNLDNIEKYL